MNYKTIHSKLFPILTSGREIGIFCSGGFDSTVLLFTCLKIIKDSYLNTDLQVFTVPRHDDSIVHAQRIVDYMNKFYGINLSIQAVGNPDVIHHQQVASGIRSALNHCDQILLGTTKNPDTKEVPDGYHDRPRSTNPLWVQPFIDHTKRYTVALAYELGFTDCATLTHSCTESTGLRCGICWWCNERAWAFAVNGLTDTGTM